MAGISVLGGVWLADGRMAGAFISLAIDAARLLLLLFGGGHRSFFDLMLNLALGVAVIWVLPQLMLARAADARQL